MPQRLPADPTHPPDATRGRSKAAVDAALARYTRTRERLDATAAGHVQRRISEIDVPNQALILAALAFMLMVPVLVSLAALVPLGGGDSGVAAQRLGLSAEATTAVQTLFPARGTVRGATTIFGTLFAVVSAFSWPVALQRAYELAWGLPSLGWRSVWRPLLWLAAFIVFGTLVLAAPPLVTSWVHAVVLGMIGLPVTIAWAWWTQRLLLGGRIGWRALLPGAILIGLGIVGLRVLAGLFLSMSITQQFHQYGPLGIVFIVLSWLVAFSTVMLGGAVAGAAWHEHRQRRESEGLPPAAGDAPAETGA